MNELELILDCQKGNSNAFELLIKPYLDMAYRTAYLITHNHHLAQDAVQEGLVEIFHNINRFDVKRNTIFKSWVYKIITYRALNLIRKEKVTFELNEGVQSKSSLMDSILKKEEQQLIWNAVHNIKIEHRTVIILYYFEEFSVRDIAVILGIREGTVKSRLHKARQLIARKLSKANGSEFHVGWEVLE